MTWRPPNINWENFSQSCEEEWQKISSTKFPFQQKKGLSFLSFYCSNEHLKEENLVVKRNRNLIFWTKKKLNEAAREGIVMGSTSLTFWTLIQNSYDLLEKKKMKTNISWFAINFFPLFSLNVNWINVDRPWLDINYSEREKTYLTDSLLFLFCADDNNWCSEFQLK